MSMQPGDDFEAHRWVAGGEALPYRLLRPAPLPTPQHEAEAEGQARYPLVLFFHGAGERGDDNRSQLVHGVGVFTEVAARARHPAFVVAPQCPTGHRWVETDWSAHRHRQPSPPSQPLRLVLALLSSLMENLPVDKDRIYITGLSMGGFATWDAIARQPDTFAAAVPICGGGDEATAKTLRDLPIWAFHGAGDEVVPVGRSRRMIAALQEAGGSPRYTEYADQGHPCWTRAYHEPALLPWLFSQGRQGPRQAARQHPAVPAQD